VREEACDSEGCLQERVSYNGEADRLSLSLSSAAATAASRLDADAAVSLNTSQPCCHSLRACCD